MSVSSPPAGPPESRASPLTVLLATLTGNVTWVLASLVFGFLSMLVGWIPPRGNLAIVCARWWARSILWASGVRVEASFVSTLDRSRSYVLMANHQSMYDIPVILASLPLQSRFMAKRSLFLIPIIGWAMWISGFLPVDRRDRSRAKETFAAAVARLRAGTSVVLFPEETRSRDGRILPFARGGFLLAIKSGLAIVPIGIAGTIDVRTRGSVAIRPSKVTVAYGSPVEVAGRGVREKRNLVAEVREQVRALSGGELAVAVAEESAPAADEV